MKGFVIWFTGIPASGKSTLALEIQKELEAKKYLVENLDADEVRNNLSPNLGFTEEARNENTKRLAWFAHKLSNYGVNVLVAAVSSKRAHRDRARRYCEKFMEIYVKCPLEICQQRDPKGLYKRAEKGEIDNIAGLHQSYEPPFAAEIVVETTKYSIGECKQLIMNKLYEFLALWEKQ